MRYVRGEAGRLADGSVVGLEDVWCKSRPLRSSPSQVLTRNSQIVLCRSTMPFARELYEDMWR